MNEHHTYEHGPVAGWSGYVVLPGGVLFYAEDGTTHYEATP